MKSADFSSKAGPAQGDKAGAAQTAILDPAALNELRLIASDNTATLARLTGIFLTSAEQRFAEMHRAIEERDAASLTLAAHSLKSDGRQFGALALAELCRDLEALGRAGQLDDAAPKIARAEAEFVTVRAALEAWQATRD